ncbi:MAG: LPS-assembly protein LptD, partial [Bdellovibrionales bacterium]
MPLVFLFMIVLFAPLCPAQAQVLTGYGDPDFDAPIVATPQPVGLLTGYTQAPEPAVIAPDHGVADLQQRRLAALQGGAVDHTAFSAPLTRGPVGAVPAYAPALPKPSSAPVDLEADHVSYDDPGKIATATGNVILTQEGRILRADEVRYFVDEDRVEASGNVVLNEPSGDIHLSQHVELKDKMKDGFVESLTSYLNDGSRFSANTGRRVGGTKTVMSDAIYTACDACKRNPDKAPVWQLRASEVSHDEEEAQIEYRNARFEVYGVPVAYVPYFSHPDGSIDRKSGFLSPSAGFSSGLGFFVENSYYYDIAPDQDATFGVRLMSEQAPLGLAQYRKRWDDASVQVDGGVTYADRKDKLGGVTVTQDEELRGHIYLDALWDMDEKWRSGLDLKYVSDDQYAEQYDIDNEDVLVSTLYAERFDHRDYALVQAQTYKDTRVSDLRADQPEIFPEFYASFIGGAGDVPVIDGRWDVTLQGLNLYRSGNGQDMGRLSADAGWERRLVSDYGLVADADINVRGDFYRFNDLANAGAAQGSSASRSETRLYPQAHVQVRYPVARDFERSQMMIEPIGAITAAPRNRDDDNIINEDSQDVQLDTSNLFQPNRFPGLDAVEDEVRATYGLRSGLYGHEGDYGEVFLGQSYRFDDENIPFDAGSGLDDQNSDIVGSIGGQYDERYRVGYRFQLDNETFASSRHELDISGDWNRFRAGVNYLYAKALA